MYKNSRLQRNSFFKDITSTVVYLNELRNNCDILSNCEILAKRKCYQFLQKRVVAYLSLIIKILM